jgi:cytidyltransferase-like protein
MKVAGIIAEFNPFHNGHEYIIQQAKALTHADYCVIVMSGDFVQSGKPAFCSKELRTQMALSCGADAVFMLPAVVSTASAEIFAEGAVALLASLGCVDYLCFGSELCDLTLLDRIAEVLLEEPEVYRNRLRENLSAGKSFPAAREAAVLDYFAAQPALPTLFSEHEAAIISPDDIHLALASSNSILAVEYLKALKKLHSDIRPVAIPRKSIAHLEAVMQSDAHFCSATALRQFVHGSVDEKTHVLTSIKPYVPEAIFPLYEKALFKTCPVSEDGLVSWFCHTLMNGRPEDFAAISDCDEALANALASLLFKLDKLPLSYKQIISHLTTKNYTRNRIGRVLIHLLLGIKKQELLKLRPRHYCLYARLLGFDKNSTALLHEIKNSTRVPIISKLADSHVLSDWYVEEPEATAAALRMLELDILAGNQYSLLQKERFSGTMFHEAQKNIVKI